MKTQDILHTRPRISIVVSRFNMEITGLLLKKTIESLKHHQVLDEDMTVYWVPGAIEIPIIAQEVAIKQNCEAIIVLGSVVRGETPHFDYVCKQVSHGCQRIALKYRIPIIFGVLMTENEEQAFSRLGGDRGNKGEEFAETALEIIKTMNLTRNGPVWPRFSGSDKTATKNLYKSQQFPLKN